jgi:hydrogenase maturation factor
MGIDFRVGKIDPEILELLIMKYARMDKRVIVGPGIGRDATVIDFGEKYLVAKTDPITFATDEIGRYAVHVNANDVAVMGATPKWFLATLLFPERNTSGSMVEEIFKQIADTCGELGISFCGGHTEVTYGLDRPIVIGNMLGEMDKDDLIRPEEARPGDCIILTKSIAIEGTAIIAREKRVPINGKGEAFWERCRELIREPGISILKEARKATQVAKIHAMHDPTEGGLAMGLHELARASGMGIIVEEEKIPVLPETEALCKRLGLDHLGLIASGSLLIVTSPEDAPIVLNSIKAEGINASIIGYIRPIEEGIKIKGHYGVRPLPFFPQDEISRIF